MPTIEGKKRIHRSVRGLGILAGNRREPSGGEAVPSRTGGWGLETGGTVLEVLSLRRDALVSSFKADGDSTGIPRVRYSQSYIRRLRKLIVSATAAWRTNMAVLVIACVAGGCLCSGTGDCETRLTASVKSDTCDDQNGTDAYYIIALIMDKMPLKSVKLTELLESSPTQLNFDFMQFFNWSDGDKFVTRSNIVFAPVKRDTSKKTNATSKETNATPEKEDDTSKETNATPGEEDEGHKGVILYPDRDPNGMLYIQLVLIKESGTKDWMNELAWNSALTGTSSDRQRRLSPLLSDLSVQSGFTAAILSNVDSKDIVSWNTFSFFRNDDYGFAAADLSASQEFSIPIDCRNGGSQLEVTVWNRRPS